MITLIQTLLFILSKWDTSMDEFHFIGKILFYVPNILNNIFIQVLLFSLFPILYIIFYFKEKLEPYRTFYNIIMNMFMK